MRVFEIYDSTKRKRPSCATLYWDEQTGSMHIEIDADATEADLPVMLGIFAQQGERTIPDKWARRWVEERIPPSGRQNLGEILRANGLEEYDALTLLAHANGRSAQDDFLLRDVSSRYEYESVSLPNGQEGESDESRQFGWCEVVGPEIASARKALGITQRELAEKTGINQAAISRIESGKGNPTLDTLDVLAEGVGMHLLVKLV